MKLLAGAGVLLALGAGLGTYFGLGGSSSPETPKTHKSRILERATREGVVDGYRVRHLPHYGNLAYDAMGGQIELHSFGSGCGGGFAAGPACLARPGPLLTIEYSRAAAAKARAILRIAHEIFPKAQVKFFEVTLDTRTAPVRPHIETPGPPESFLAEARFKGIIEGYHSVTTPGAFGHVRWVTDDGIDLEIPDACGGNGCPMHLGPPILWIEYAPDASAQAAELLRLARQRWDGKIEFFEVTTGG